MRRVDEAIRQVIGDALASDLKDPRVGFVTVTDVKTSSDLSHARVYVSVLGERACAELSGSIGYRDTVRPEQVQVELVISGAEHLP